MNNNIKTNHKTDAHLEISKFNEYIYLGSCEHPLSESDEFNELGIDVIINCAKEIHYPPQQNGYVIVKFPIIESDDVSMLENIDAARDLIDKCVTNKKKIYLHCVGGISRAPAILVYYLMTRGFNYIDAHDLVQTIRPIIDIDDAFTNQLQIIDDIP